MRRILPLLKRGILLLANMSLIKKSILVYSLIIMIPVIVSGFYIYSGFQRSLNDEIASGLQKNADQMARDILQRSMNVESVSTMLTNQINIKNFMSLSREMNDRNEKLYFDYVETTLPLLKDALYFHSFDIFKISIYIDSSANPNIVERGDVVFSDSRLLNFTWYQQLIHSQDKSVWLPPHLSKLYTPNEGGGDTMVFTYVQKIISSNGTYLGVAVLDIRQSDMLSSMIGYNSGAADNQVYITDGKSNFVLFPKQLDKAAEADIIREHAKNPDKYIYSGSNFYIFEKTNLLGLTIVCKANMQKVINAARASEVKIILVFLAGLLLLIGLTYVSIRTVFKRLKQIVSTMNSVAKGKFDMRIPVGRRDEVGQISEDFNILIEKINALIESLVDKEIAQKDAQLLALQYQINPHFIYNMIDVFRMRMVLMNDDEAAAAITDFGKILRYNIGNQSKYSTLKDEIENVRKYINIQKFRYPERIRLKVILPDGLEKLRMLKFILQPIVENSIKYGLTDSVAVMDIVIAAEKDERNILLTVQDNGRGMDPAKLEEVSAMLEHPEEGEKSSAREGGIGLANINKRLKLFYGDQYCIRVDSSEGRTRIELSIPCE